MRKLYNLHILYGSLISYVYFNVRQIKVNVLSEEKRLLMDQVRALRRGEEPAAPLLPPTLDPDLSEEELEGRLASLRSAALSAAHSAASSRHHRHRSPSREFNA